MSGHPPESALDVARPVDLRFVDLEGFLDALDACDLLEEPHRPVGPFAEPAWLRSWWSAYRRTGVVLHDEFCGVVVESDGEVVGAAALAISTVLRSRLRIARPLGIDHGITELPGVVARAGWDGPVRAALADAVHGRLRCQVARWASVLPDSAGASALARHPHRFVAWPPDLVVDLPSSFDELKAGLSRNTKQAIRKARNAPAVAGLEVIFRVLDQPSDVDAALPRFFDLHARRAAAPDLEPHPDMFATPAARRVLTEAVSALARDRRVRVFELLDGDEVIASRLAFLRAGELYLYFSGFRPEHARVSVMMRLQVEILEWAIAVGVERVNLSVGEDRSKTRWQPRYVPIQAAFTFRSPRWRKACSMVLDARESLRRQRSHPVVERLRTAYWRLRSR